MTAPTRTHRGNLYGRTGSIGRLRSRAAVAAVVALLAAGAGPVFADSNPKPPVDSPAFDNSPEHSGNRASVVEGDADRVGGLTLAAAAVLVLVALAARLAGGQGGDSCPVCRATLSLSGGQVRCPACGFRRLRGRGGETFFGAAAPAGIDYRARPVSARRPPDADGAGEAGGFRGSW